MGVTRFYVDPNGVYLGGFAGVEPPAGSVEIDAPPAHGSQVRNMATGEWSAPTLPVPQAVGRAQAKIWLHRAGKLTAVQTYIDGANDAELSLWWDEATTFERQNPHILALAAGFDIDLDTAFREAAAI